MKLFNPFAIPLMKSSLPVSKQPDLFRISSIIPNANRRIVNPTEEALQMLRRRIREDGFEVIDKPTFNKLTRDFRRHGGEIRQDEEAKAFLQSQKAHAIYMAGGENLLFLRENPTVSDVLEETYHAMQDRKNMFGDNPFNPETLVRREIDAQKYLLRVANKYKIPENELRTTRANLEKYEKDLSDILKGKR